ncbi:hypothetical protein GBO31_13310 [Aquimarina litoralis]|nr:hypothetical protein [Aquimarina litoralis]
MFRRDYKVKGEDVNDYMYMEKTAYQKYMTSIINTFLFEKGFIKKKMKTLPYLQSESSDSLMLIKPLMFLQDFFINLELIHIDKNLKNIQIKSRFFNADNELCVMAHIHFCGFDNAMMNKNKIIKIDC